MARSKARKLADMLSGGNALSDGVIASSEVVGLGTAASSSATDFVSATGGTITGEIHVLDNVGIGTSSPVSKIHLQNASGGSEGYLKVTDAVYGGDVRFGMADGVDNDAIVGVWSNNNVKFYTDSTERLRIDSSGRVGINDTAPSSLLQLTQTSDNSSGGLQIRNTADSNSIFIYQNGSVTTYDAGSSGEQAFKTANTERLRIDSSGNVGIGTSSPDQLLTVGNTSTQYTRLQFYAATNGASTIHFGDGTSGASSYQGYLNYAHDSNSMQFATSGSERMRLESDGDLHVDGNVIAYSTTISDERLKTDIVKIDSALDKVDQINGYTFTYTADGKKSAGVIAQEVEKVLPSAITESTLPLKMGDDDTEYKTVQYDQLIGLLVEAVKELKAEVAELKGA